MRRTYQPDRGDLIIVDFTPHAGTEQAGRRPAIVLSPRAYNVATGLLYGCPITNQVKGSPFEVPLPPGTRPTGVVLVSQMRALDWLSRNAALHGRAPDALLQEVVARLSAIIVDPGT